MICHRLNILTQHFISPKETRTSNISYVSLTNAYTILLVNNLLLMIIIVFLICINNGKQQQLIMIVLTTCVSIRHVVLLSFQMRN